MSQPPESDPEARREAMLPSATQLQAPLAPSAEPPPLPRRFRKVKGPARALPPPGVPLAGAAAALALGAMALEAMDMALGVVMLPFAGLLLALAAALPAKPLPGVPMEPAKVRLVMLALAALAMLLALALVQGLALVAAVGIFLSFADLASAFVKAYPLLLGAMLLAGAALRAAAGLWGEVLEVPRGRRLLAGALAGGAALVAAAMALAAAPGGPEALTLTVERAPFVAAMAVLAGLGAVWAGALPSFPQMGEWLSREGLRHGRLARQLTHALGGSALAALGLAMAVAVTVDAALGVALLGLALGLAMGAGFPAGVARCQPSIASEDPDQVLRRRRQALLGMLAGSAAGIAAAAAGLLATILLWGDEGAATLAGFSAAGAAVGVQAALALVSIRFPVPGALPRARRAAAWDLSLLALLLVLFAVLLGAGLSEGPGVGPALGAALLLAAALASGGHGLLRVVLKPVSVDDAPRKPRKARKVEKSAAAPDTKERVTRTMHLTYAAGLVFSVVMVGLVASTSLGVVDVEASTGLSLPVALGLAGLMFAPVAAFLAWRWLQAKRVEVEQKRKAQTSYKRRLTPQEVSRLAILGASVTAAAVFGIFAVLTQLGVLQSLGPFQLAPKYSTDFFVFAILVGLGPYGFMRAREQARERAIDSKFPEFLRDLAESKRAGMTLTQAVITASKGNYGALTPDIRKMAAQIEWGVSFSEALERFARRVRTPLIERSVSLIVQASAAGGNVVDILHAAAQDAREIQLMLRERKTSMSIYVMIIYIAFFVFIAVIAILDAQFLPEVSKAVGKAQGVSVGPIKFGKIDTEGFKQVFFHAAIIQAMGGGFVAGVMEEGRPVAGLRHVFIMVILGYVAFRFLIGG